MQEKLMFAWLLRGLHVGEAFFEPFLQFAALHIEGKMRVNTEKFSWNRTKNKRKGRKIALSLV
jgi:hypothetical protein